MSVAPYSDTTKLPAAFKGMLNSLPSMTGKTVAITGCTSGTGLVLAQVAAKQGATIICLNRPSKRAEKAVEQLKEAGATVIHVDCDLTSMTSVRAAGPLVMTAVGDNGLDVLCCNAGIMHSKDIPTDDGFDPQMQVNQIAHFMLISQLWPALTKAGELRGEARVVMHSSAARNFDGHCGMATMPGCARKLQAPYFEKHEAGGLGGEGKCICMFMFCGKTETRYQQSKLANFVFAFALRDKIIEAGSKVKSIVAHPGVAKTQLFYNGPAKSGFLPNCMGPILECMLMQSTENGSLGIIRGSLASDTVNGDFFGPSYPCYPWVFWGAAVRRKPETRFAEDKAGKELVWKKCEEACGMTFSVEAATMERT